MYLGEHRGMLALQMRAALSIRRLCLYLRLRSSISFVTCSKEMAINLPKQFSLIIGTPWRLKRLAYTQYVIRYSPPPSIYNQKFDCIYTQSEINKKYTVVVKINLQLVADSKLFYSDTDRSVIWFKDRSKWFRQPRCLVIKKSLPRIPSPSP